MLARVQVAIAEEVLCKMPEASAFMSAERQQKLLVH